MKNKILIFFLSFLLIATHTSAAMQKLETNINGYPTAIFTPSNFNASNSYPLILFFHGYGQTGGGTSNINRLYTDGLPKVLNEGYVPPDDYIIVAPQDNWGGINNTNVPAILNTIKSQYNIDPNRIYITGLSAGGGTAGLSMLAVSNSFLSNFAAGVLFSPTPITETNASWFTSAGVKGVWALGGTQSADNEYRANAINVANAINAKVPGLAKITTASGIGHGGSFTSLYNGSFNDAGTTFWNYIASKVRGGSSTTPNQYPTASAGSDKTITLPTNSVTLSGSGSDSDGSITSYVWSQTQGPNSISIPSGQNPLISNLISGTYTFRLTVTDNKGATGTDDMNVMVNPAVIVPNQPPTASAGSDKTITLPTNSVILSGSGSDPDGTISYAWTTLSSIGSPSISSPSSASTQITNLTTAGQYLFRLTVTDDDGATATSNVYVTVNPEPITGGGTTDVKTFLVDFGFTNTTSSGWNNFNTIAAGSAQSLKDSTNTSTNTTIQIVSPFVGTNTSGTSSSTLYPSTATSDAFFVGTFGGNTYDSAKIRIAGLNNSSQYTFIMYGSRIANDGGNRNTRYTISGQSVTQNSTDNINGTVQISGVYPSNGVVDLTVSREAGSLFGYINVLKIVESASGTTTPPPSNSAPTASAGPDRSVTLPTNQTILFGSGSDSDGSITSYVWSQTQGPSSITIPSGQNPLISNLISGTYTFRLTVTDNKGATGTDDLNITVNPAVIVPNQPPTASAGSNKTITLPTNSVILSGSGSDPDGTISYAWTTLSSLGSPSISSPSSASTQITNLTTAGQYLFRLTVTDDDGATATSNVYVIVNPASNVPNNAPTVSAGPDKFLPLPTNHTTLYGSGSDSDGSISSYVWTRVSGSGDISNPTSATTNITNLSAGTSEFQLQVTDNLGATAMDKIQIFVFVGPTLEIPVGVDMVDIATGEYATGYVKSDGTVWNVVSTSYDNAYAVRQVTGLTNIVEADGGQYNTVYRKNTGQVYSLRGGSITPTAYPLDNTGAPFLADKVYAMWRNIVALKNGEVWYWSADNQDNEDMLKQFNNTIAATIAAPRKLIQPPNKNLTKCVHGSGISPYTNAKLWCIASDGTLWQWDQTRTTPIQVTGKLGRSETWSGSVVDAALMGPTANVVVTSTNQVWVWGYASSYIGGKDDWQNMAMTNIAPNLVAAGAVFPLKQIIANYVSIHVIDANNNHFAIGNNATGAIGNGFMTPSWRTNYNGTSSNPYGFSWSMDHYSQPTWVQIPGKWKSIKTNTSVVFYSFGQDLAGNWYSWGRAKAQVLGNGFAWKSADQSQYPDWRDIPAPRLVTPITQSWTVDGPVNPAMARPPLANAGINQYLSSGTSSTTLYGSGSHQQQPTNSTTVTMSNVWTRVSGPNNPTIVSPTSLNTNVTGLVNGTYVFRNTVTNSLGATDYQQVTVVVGSGFEDPSNPLPVPPNNPPKVNANIDQVVGIAQADPRYLLGSATDLDGTIVSYSWSKISGPGVQTMTLNNIMGSLGATVKGLQEGVYTFRLTVTDNLGATGSDDVMVTVNPNKPPVVSAGPDITIVKPTTYTLLYGTATDPDSHSAFAVTYRWTKISGSGTISYPTEPRTYFTRSSAGTTVLRLTATDNLGASASDEISVKVLNSGQATIDGPTVAGASTTAQANIDYENNLMPEVTVGSVNDVLLPQNSIQLTGTAMDKDGTIVAMEWYQVAGPNNPTTGAINQNVLNLSGLVQGDYIYAFSATDNLGDTNTAEVAFKVRPSSKNELVTVKSTNSPIMNISTVKPFDIGTRATVSATTLNVRSLPSTTSSIVAKLSKGDAVEIIGKSTNQDWLQIRSGVVVVGYVHKNYLSVVPDTNPYNSTGNNVSGVGSCPIGAQFNPSTGAPCSTSTSTVTGASVYVKATRLNMRSSDTSSAPIVRILDRGVSLQIISSVGLWLQVRTEDGAIGYVHKDYVATTSPSPVYTRPTMTTPSVSTGQIRVRVNALKLNIRASGSSASTLVGSLNQGDIVDILAVPALSQWIQIKTATGTVGWVNKNYVSVI